uniref:RNA-directed DNA polymerase n=1 Tax=Strongyloides papillosus TaxID=174720 RepID=A0A0N5BGZ4_STREA
MGPKVDKKVKSNLSESDQFKEVENRARVAALKDVKMNNSSGGNTRSDDERLPVDNSRRTENGSGFNDPGAHNSEEFPSLFSVTNRNVRLGVGNGPNGNNHANNGFGGQLGNVGTESTVRNLSKMVQQYVRMEDLARLFAQFLDMSRAAINTPGQSQVRSVNDNDRGGRESRKCPAKEPDEFKPGMDFKTWKMKFDWFFDVNEFDIGKKLRVLKTYLSNDILKDIAHDDELMEDYDLLCRYLNKTYSSATSEISARKELKYLLSKKVNNPEEIEDVGKKIDKLIDAKLYGLSKEVVLKEKIDTLSYLLPPECQTVYDNTKNYSNFQDAISSAKAIWSQMINAELRKQRGQGIVKNKKFNKNNSKNSSEVRCYSCNEVGHIKTKCPKKKKKDQTNTITTEVSENKENDKVQCNAAQVDNSVNTIEDLRIKDKLIGTHVEVNGEPTTALVDTGSNCIIINPTFAKKLNLKTIDAEPVSSFQTNHEVKKVKDKVKIKILGEEYLFGPVLIGSKDFPNKKYEIIIGMNLLRVTKAIVDLTKGKLLKDKEKPDVDENNNCNLILDDTEDDNEAKEFLKKMKSKYPNCVQKNEWDLGPGKLVSGPIEIFEDKEPYRYPIYPIPHNQKSIAKEAIDKLVKAKVLEPSKSQYLHPIMMVQKSTPNKYNIPNQRELFQKIGRFSYCSKLDLCDAFYQISLPTESRKYMGIRTDEGDYQFTRLVQGASNSAAEMQRCLTNAFISLKDNVHVFVDDLLITSVGTKEEHKEILDKVFSLCNGLELKINFNKCKMFATSCTFLGHQLSREGIKPSEENIKIFLKRPFPKTRRQLLGTLQSANYYRNFIKDFSRICSPLYEATKNKKSKLELTDEQKACFRELCEKMQSVTMLYHPDKSGKYILTTDSSVNYGIERPLSYFSHKLKSSIRGRSATYLELLGIAEAVTFYKYILTGAVVEIRTDHKPLLSLKRNTTDRRFLELIAKIDSVNCSLVYFAGAQNHVVDDLSRNSSQALEDNDEDDGNNSFVIQQMSCNSISSGTVSGKSEVKQPRRRGRPPKSERKRRGRPPKVKVDIDTSEKLPPPTLNKFEASNFEKQRRINEKEVFRLAHDENGHFGFEKMKSLIESRTLDIPNLDAKIKMYVKNCDLCQRRNVAMRRIPELKPVVYDSPGLNLSIDLMGPISPPAADGSKYILCAIDGYSRYCYLLPLKSYKFEELGPELNNKVFCYGGYPKSIRTDGAGNFVSEEFKSWLKSLNIEHSISSPHHSTGNSLVERSFRWIASTVSKVCKEKPHAWPQMLPMIMYNYNSTKNSTTGSSPFFLNHLREPCTLLDQYLKTYSVGIFDKSQSSYELLERASIIRKAAADAIQATREFGNENKKCYNIKEYKKGDKILIEMPDMDKNISSKFKMLYKGPFIVTRQENDHVYYKKPNSNKERQATVSKVKAYHDDNLEEKFNQIEASSISKDGEVRTKCSFH